MLIYFRYSLSARVIEYNILYKKGVPNRNPLLNGGLINRTTERAKR